MSVLVTGIGVVSPLGLGAEPTWRGLLEGHCAIGPLRLFELEGCRVDIAAEVPSLDVRTVAPADEQRAWSRADAMAVLAAREALASAGLDRGTSSELVVGGTTSGMFECEELLAELTRQPQADVDEQALRPHPLTAPADRVHERLGPFRRVRTLCSACSGGAAAIIVGATAIDAGRADLVLAGGVDGLCRLTYSGFAALGALDRSSCRPFDRDRAGLSLGEGAAFLLLESERSARRRSVEPIARLAGWGMAAEAHHSTHPEPSGRTATWVMRRALQQGGLTPADVDYVNAHGTATPHNDAMECRALANCLAEEIHRIGISSTKGHMGHALGAAGAIEAAITCLAIARSVLPPTVGLAEVDPECGANHLRQTREQPVRAALSNSFGFGGTDTSLLFARSDAVPSTATPARPSSPSLVVVTGAGTVGPLGITGSEQAAGYVDPSRSPAPEADCGELSLDLSRARRFDRPARLATVAIERSLQEAGLLEIAAAGQSRVGATVGSAFGSVGTTGRYLQRLFDKGARWASPALFPAALPSALGASPSMYLHLTGPVLSTADSAVSAESSLVTAIELVAAGNADAMAAAAVEERSEVAERVSGPLYSGLTGPECRGEGAAALVVETATAARARGAKIRAFIAGWTSWRGTGQTELADLPPPRGRAAVYSARQLLDVELLPRAWGTVPSFAVAARAGNHESAGGFAAAAAVAAIETGVFEAVLVLAAAADRGHALLLRATDSHD